MIRTSGTAAHPLRGSGGSGWEMPEVLPSAGGVSPGGTLPAVASPGVRPGSGVVITRAPLDSRLAAACRPRSQGRRFRSELFYSAFPAFIRLNGRRPARNRDRRRSPRKSRWPRRWVADMWALGHEPSPYPPGECDGQALPVRIMCRKSRPDGHDVSRATTAVFVPAVDHVGVVTHGPGPQGTGRLGQVLASDDARRVRRRPRSRCSVRSRSTPQVISPLATFAPICAAISRCRGSASVISSSRSVHAARSGSPRPRPQSESPARGQVPETAT